MEQVDFQIVVLLILVLVCLRISCKTKQKSTLVLQNPGSGYAVCVLHMYDEGVKGIFLVGSHLKSIGVIGRLIPQDWAIPNNENMYDSRWSRITETAALYFKYEDMEPIIRGMRFGS